MLVEWILGTVIVLLMSTISLGSYVLLLVPQLHGSCWCGELEYRIYSVTLTDGDDGIFGDDLHVYLTQRCGICWIVGSFSGERMSRSLYIFTSSWTC